MTKIFILDTITVCTAFGSILLILLKWKKIRHHFLAVLILFFLLMLGTYGSFLLLEWGGFSYNLEAYEDLTGAILPILWIIIFYILIDSEKVKKLTESEERLRLVIEGAHLGTWDWNIQTDEVVFNERWANMLGYVLSELAPRFKTWKDLVHPDDLPGVMEILKDHLEGKTPYYETEKRMRTSSGNWKWVLAQGKVLETDQEGKPLRVAGTHQDITERKQMENELKQSNEEYLAINEEVSESLEKIQQINNELARAKKKAEESDKLKTAFLANLSHEIRTPMNGILGFAELLKVENLSMSSRKKYIEVIELSGQRLLRLIADLVDISKIEVGQVELKNEPTQLNQIFNRAYAFFEPQAGRKGLSLSCEKGLEDHESYIMADSLKLEQVITNLISNALKFTLRGSIGFGYRIEDQNLLIWVKDTGKGIAPEMRELIFERFMQTDNTPLRGEEGSGLGLSICKAYVELMKGKVWVESKPDKGSVFWVSIPYLASLQTKDGKAEDSVNEDTYKDISILIAEDDETSYLLLSEVLRKSQIQIIHARNGQEAIDHIRENPDISLILMDIKMPVKNGLDATQEIHKEYPNIPILAQTAYASIEDRQKALDAGCVDYISKPVNKKELLDKIHKLL